MRTFARTCARTMKSRARCAPSDSHDLALEIRKLSDALGVKLAPNVGRLVIFGCSITNLLDFCLLIGTCVCVLCVERQRFRARVRVFARIHTFYICCVEAGRHSMCTAQRKEGIVEQNNESTLIS